MEKKNVVLLTVIAVATLLITVVGATFAYYAANVQNGDSGEQITITSAKGLAINFDDGATVTGTNILPGWTNTKTVTVSNSSDYELEYTIRWTAVTNEIADKENLKYSAAVKSDWIADDKHTHDSNTSVSDIAEKATPTKTTDVFAEAQKIKPGEQITYTITLKYEDLVTAQGSPDTSQEFTATLSLVESDVKVVSTTPSKPVE